jgi:hypothetical protein
MDLQRQTPGDGAGIVLSAHLVGDLLAAPVSNGGPLARTGGLLCGGSRINPQRWHQA